LGSRWLSSSVFAGDPGLPRPAAFAAKRRGGQSGEANLRQRAYAFDFAWSRSGEAEHENIQRRRKGERIKSPATPDFAEKFLKTDVHASLQNFHVGATQNYPAKLEHKSVRAKKDEPGASLRQNVFTFDFARSGEAEHKSIQRRRKAKDESTLAETGHKQVPRVLTRGAPLTQYLREGIHIRATVSLKTARKVQ